jgi:CheY-like chemotaxis protein
MTEATQTVPNEQTSATPLRVLCVDDNWDAADSLGTLLGLLGYNVVVANDAESALQRYSEFNPQACILDITMPGMDGCELAARLREGPNGKDMLLLALTALQDYRSLERMADAGFDLYYAKPVTAKELCSVLNDFAQHGRPEASR